MKHGFAKVMLGVYLVSTFLFARCFQRKIRVCSVFGSGCGRTRGARHVLRFFGLSEF